MTNAIKLKRNSGMISNPNWTVDLILTCNNSPLT